jgi:GNAT superfamily N-acetyltransferase
MSDRLGTYWLKDRRTGQEVQATLWQSIDDRHVEDFAQKWKPIFEARKAELRLQGDLTLEIAGEHNLQDAHWEWARKVEQRRDGLAWTSFAVEAQDVTQGLMFVRMDAFACEPSQRHKPIVDIDLLATAPWNRFRLVAEPQFKGIGRLLLAAAVSLSIHEEFNGRISLHALPQAESWYRDVCGMTDLGIDGTGMRYFEMTEAQAKAFVS